MMGFTMTQLALVATLAVCAVGAFAWAAFAESGRRRIDTDSRQLGTAQEALRVEIQESSEARVRAEAERTALQQQLRERDEAVQRAQEERSQLGSRMEAMSEELQSLKSGLARAETERDALHTQLRARDELDQRAQAERQQLNDQIARLSTEAQALKSGKERAEAESSTLREQLQTRDEADKLAKVERKQEREKDRTDMLGQLSERFQVLASQALEQKREAVQGAGEQAVKLLVDPLQKDLKSFRDKIERSYDQANKERGALEAVVKQLSEASTGLGDEARQLTKALKGESQTRGYWGEMILQKLLEDAGLELGRHYVSQQTFRDEDGKGMRPDVVLQLPGDRCVVIDAKVSLNDYERAVSTDDTKVRDKAMRAHVKSIERHIVGLASKKYQELAELDGKNPDFVFLFVPLEAAYIAAYQAEPRLLQQARDRKVALLSPATLLPVLLMVAELWRVELRNRNAEQIATVAGRMYDKLITFINEYDKMGQRLNHVQIAWEGAHKLLGEGRGNVLRKMDQLKQLGARTTKLVPKKFEKLPQSYLDTLGGADSAEAAAEVRDEAPSTTLAVEETTPLPEPDSDGAQDAEPDRAS